MKGTPFLLILLVFSFGSGTKPDALEDDFVPKNGNEQTEYILESLLDYHFEDKGKLAPAFGAGNVYCSTFFCKLFSQSDKEVMINWLEGDDIGGTKLQVGVWSAAREKNTGTAWRTSKGLYVGMGLEEMVKIVGDFQLVMKEMTVGSVNNYHWIGKFQGPGGVTIEVETTFTSPGQVDAKFSSTRLVGQGIWISSIMMKRGFGETEAMQPQDGQLRFPKEENVMVCTFKGIDSGDCTHYEFSCGDFMDVELNLDEAGLRLWNSLSKYKGRKFEITYSRIQKLPCNILDRSDTNTKKIDAPLVTKFRLMKD